MRRVRGVARQGVRGTVEPAQPASVHHQNRRIRRRAVHVQRGPGNRRRRVT